MIRKKPRDKRSGGVGNQICEPRLYYDFCSHNNEHLQYNHTCSQLFQLRCKAGFCWRDDLDKHECSGSHSSLFLYSFPPQLRSLAAACSGVISL